MSAPPGSAPPAIPSVFVTHTAGAFMARLLASAAAATTAGSRPDDVTVYIAPSPSLQWLLLVVSALLAAMTLLLILASLWYVRRWRDWSGFGGGNGPPLSPGAAGYMRLRGGGGRAGSGGAVGGGADGPLPPCMMRSLPVLIYESARASQGGSGTADWNGGGSGAAAEQEVEEVHEEAATRGDGNDGSSRGTTSLRGGAAVAVAESGALVALSDEEDDDSSEGGLALAGGDGGGGGLHAGATRHACAICIEHYSEGDKVRRL